MEVNMEVLFLVVIISFVFAFVVPNMYGTTPELAKFTRIAFMASCAVSVVILLVMWFVYLSQ